MVPAQTERSQGPRLGEGISRWGSEGGVGVPEGCGSLGHPVCAAISSPGPSTGSSFCVLALFHQALSGAGLVPPKG